MNLNGNGSQCINNRRYYERGQITVLMVFAVIALFGAAALSIDGGMLYFQRRAAQSAADNAAMTGALAIAKGYTSSEIQTIIFERTIKNGFDNSSDGVDVQVYWPPQAPNPYAGNYDFIQVIITSRIPLAFVHFVYKGPVEVTVEAVGHARPSTDLVSGFAVYSANDRACEALKFSGNPDVQISGGGNIGSNSDAGCDCAVDPVTGAPTGGSGVNKGNVTLEVIDGDITSAGCWGDYGESGYVSPAPTTTVPQEDMNKLESLVPTPDCGGTPTNGKVHISGVETLSPGIYESIKLASGADVTLEPGLYCITGKDVGWSVEMKGGSSLYGDGVMFYLSDPVGGWKSAGDSHIELFAPTGLLDASGNQWAGMLIYGDPAMTNDIVLTGGSNSWFEGSIYALGSHCDVEGNGGAVAFKTQVICDTIRINGTGDLDIFYDEERNYHVPASIDLSQ
jgi:hypothetical protein